MHLPGQSYGRRQDSPRGAAWRRTTPPVVRPFLPADEQALLARALERLGPRVRIRIERVAQIERTRNGKFRQIISRLSGEQ